MAKVENHCVKAMPKPRLRPPSKWFTAFCLAVTCACLALSYWQHQRARLKQDLQDQANAWLSSKPLGNVDLSSGVADELRWRPAVAIGKYDTNGQLLIDNRVHNRRAGFYVVTPLLLDEGRWVLVNRGWLAAPQRREHARAPAAPSGAVTVAGLLVPDERQSFELGPDLGANGVWQHLKIERWATDNGKDVVPMVLLAEHSTSELVPVAKVPDFRAGASRGYRLQWLAFALICVFGWLAVALRGPDK